MRFALGVRAPQILGDSYPPRPLWGHDLGHPRARRGIRTWTHTHTHTTLTAQLGVRRGGHPGSEVGDKGERRKRLQTAGPWGRASRLLARTQIHSMGGETGQADGQGSPRGPGGLPGHWERTGSGFRCPSPPWPLGSRKRYPPPSPDGATAQKASAYSSVTWAVEMRCP